MKPLHEIAMSVQADTQELREEFLQVVIARTRAALVAEGYSLTDNEHYDDEGNLVGYTDSGEFIMALVWLGSQLDSDLILQSAFNRGPIEEYGKK